MLAIGFYILELFIAGLWHWKCDGAAASSPRHHYLLPFNGEAWSAQTPLFRH